MYTIYNKILFWWCDELSIIYKYFTIDLKVTVLIPFLQRLLVNLFLLYSYVNLYSPLNLSTSLFLSFFNTDDFPRY